ncbi:MAG: hypothetical protein WC865_12550 [Bacteroidales bacterium]
MKARIIVSLLLVTFLAGPVTVMAQSSKEKKINRELRKIERHSRKLQELQGIDFTAAQAETAAVNDEEIARIREEATAQADEWREQVREAMEQQREAIEEQRQALEEQRQAIEEQLREMQDSKLEELGDLKDSDEFIELKHLKDLPKMKKFKGGVYIYKAPKGAFTWTEPKVIDIPDIKLDIEKSLPHIAFFSNQDNLSINKTLTDESSTADFNYEVKEGANGMSVLVNGAIDSGKVKITIKRPDGEVYNEYTLSSLANVNWKQNIKFEDQKESEYLGKWTVNVTAEKAKGTYSVQLNGR